MRMTARTRRPQPIPMQPSKLAFSAHVRASCLHLTTGAHRKCLSDETRVSMSSVDQRVHRCIWMVPTRFSDTQARLGRRISPTSSACASAHAAHAWPCTGRFGAPHTMWYGGTRMLVPGCPQTRKHAPPPQLINPQSATTISNNQQRRTCSAPGWPPA